MEDGSEVCVYIFNGADPSEKGRPGFPSGVFSSREKAEAWIEGHGLSGTLTAYPLDQGAYDWELANGRFKPRRDDQRTPAFIGRFAGGFHHWHYDDDIRERRRSNGTESNVDVRASDAP